MRIAFALVFALAATAATSAQALEPFQSYDTFRQGPIDGARWLDGERSRRIREGELRLMQRSFGLDSDVGLNFIGWNENIKDPGSITGIKARMRVNALEVGSCASNPTLSAQSRARIIGTFFGGVDFLSPPATPDSLMGDVLAQVRAVRSATSLDPAGVLRVQGLVTVCNTADCNQAIILFPLLNLGTVMVGESTTVQVQWDQPSKTFYFSRDNGAFSGSVSYGFDDSRPANVSFKELSTRMDIPNCAGTPSTGVVDASFDRVSVTRRVAP